MDNCLLRTTLAQLHGFCLSKTLHAKNPNFCNTVAGLYPSVRRNAQSVDWSNSVMTESLALVMQAPEK